MLKFLSRLVKKPKPETPKAPETPKVSKAPKVSRAPKAPRPPRALEPKKQPSFTATEAKKPRTASQPAPVPVPRQATPSQDVALPGGALVLAPRPRRSKRRRQRVRRPRPRMPLSRPEGNKGYSLGEVQAAGLAPADLRGRLAVDRRRRSQHSHNRDRLREATTASHR